jgi:hypothetical protein
MKPNSVILTIILLFASSVASSAQDGQTGNWIRVQSDNGEFSIEVPEDFSYFFDSEGFTVATSQKDHPVREMNLLNAYSEKTLLSFEIYRASRDAMGALIELAVERGVRQSKAKFKGIEVKELSRSEDNDGDRRGGFYLISRYFRSKEFVYVLSGLSRQGETPAMKRFFDSMIFTPDKGTLQPGVKRLGELKVSPVDVKDADPPPTPDKNAVVEPKSATSDPDYWPSVIAIKPRASYAKQARDHNLVGAVRLRLVLDEKGYIPKIYVLRKLPDGLVRQSVFAALRLKFLPAEKGNKSVPKARTLEYTFSIY